MDYLGYETDGMAHHPKMMIEAKRFCLSLPIQDPLCPSNGHPFCERIRDIAHGRKSHGITNEWRGYIDDHLNYLRGLETRNGRLSVSAITNGDWLIIISNPHQLLSENSVEKAEILCFENLTVIEKYAEAVYERLEAVSKPDLTMGNLRKAQRFNHRQIPPKGY